MAVPRVRALTLKDLDRILAIDARLTGVKRRSGDNDLWRLIAESTTCFGVDVDGRLAGFVIAEARPWEFGNRAPVGWIIMIGVDPAHQGAGIGRLLGEHVVSEFRRLGVDELKTLVDRGDKDLLSYFRSLGFRDGGEEVLALKPGAKRSAAAKKKVRARHRR